MPSFPGSLIRRNSSRESVVVLSADSLGDQILREPLLRGLAETGKRVTVVVQVRVADLIPRIDRRLEVITSAVPPWHRDAKLEAEVLLPLILERKPALIVTAPHTLHGLHRELLLRLTDVVPSAGLFDPAGDLPPPPLTKLVECPLDLHETDKAVRLLNALVPQSMGFPDRPLPQLKLLEHDLKRARTILKERGLSSRRFVVGHPAGTLNNDSRVWPLDDFARLVMDIQRRHSLPTLLMGAEMERPLLERVARLCASEGVFPQTWVGQADDVPMMLGLISEARLYVGADTGPMHAAGALGIPVVTNMGGGHWPRFLPRARQSYAGTQKLPCFGCKWHCWTDSFPCIVRGHDQFADAVSHILRGGPPHVRVATGIPEDQAQEIWQIPASAIRPAK